MINRSINRNVNVSVGGCAVFVKGTLSCFVVCQLGCCIRFGASLRCGRAVCRPFVVRSFDHVIVGRGQCKDVPSRYGRVLANFQLSPILSKNHVPSLVIVRPVCPSLSIVAIQVQHFVPLKRICQAQTPLSIASRQVKRKLPPTSSLHTCSQHTHNPLRVQVLATLACLERKRCSLFQDMASCNDLYTTGGTLALD